AHGGAELREHPVPGALAGRGVLYREEDRPAPLAAKSESLAEATEGQEERGGQADGLVAGKEADHDGGDPHREEGCDEGSLPADPVAEVPEEGGPHRPGEEGDGKGGERREGG